MRLRVLILGIFLLGGIVAAPASALAFNQRITVYASVPEMRNIYVNSYGTIAKIVGNTSKNIEPRVYNENNQPVALTDSISQQYQQFLKSHNYKLEASKYYYLNPVTVNNQPNSQTIKIDTNTLTLGSIPKT